MYYDLGLMISLDTNALKTSAIIVAITAFVAAALVL